MSNPPGQPVAPRGGAGSLYPPPLPLLLPLPNQNRDAYTWNRWANDMDNMMYNPLNPISVPPHQRNLHLRRWARLPPPETGEDSVFGMRPYEAGNHQAQLGEHIRRTTARNYAWNIRSTRARPGRRTYRRIPGPRVRYRRQYSPPVRQIEIPSDIARHIASFL